MVRVQRRRVYGCQKTNAELKKLRGTHISTDYTVVVEMNNELRKQCEEQNVKDTEAMILAANLYAGR